MRLRTWTAVFAMLGVLLHVAALVRHHGAMLHAQLEYRALVANLAAFCHGGVDAVPSSPADLPAMPTDTQGDCPICSGLAPTFAIAAPDCLDAPVRLAASTGWCTPDQSHRALPHAVCPPARGPPASAHSARA